MARKILVISYSLRTLYDHIKIKRFGNLQLDTVPREFEFVPDRRNFYYYKVHILVDTSISFVLLDGIGYILACFRQLYFLSLLRISSTLSV